MIGKTVSHYRIFDQVGEGGMGIVFRAEDLLLKRRVALKFLPPHLVADPKARTRFLTEAQAASALDHPNICTIHEVGEADDGQLFIAMAYYSGETVAQLLKAGPLPVGQAMDIALQAARGLSKAHERGILHRDIKPSNLMASEDGLWKILDFGVARLGDATGVTRTGGVVGTVAYMSLEQAERGDVSPQSDVWSLGVLLYEMLTGNLPFRGATQVAVLYQILNEDPQPIRDLRPDVPAELERIVDRCLAKDLARRYSGMKELLEDLFKLRHAEVAPASSEVTGIATSSPQVEEPLTPPPFLTPSTGPTEEILLSPFVAREGEMEVLEGWLRDARTGGGRVGFIAGEPGTGKTALAREFYTRAGEQEVDLIVASGNCNAHTGTGDSYRPFREILAQLTGDVEAQWAAGSISADHAIRLWSVFPRTADALWESGRDLVGTFLPGTGLLSRGEAHPHLTGSQMQNLRGLTEGQGKHGRIRQADLFEQYIRVLRSLAADQPLLLVVDDLQWADEGSIRLLFDLGHHLAGTRILVLGLYRTTEVALGREGKRHPLEAVVNELAGVFGDVVLELGTSSDRAFVDALIDAEPNALSSEFRDGLYHQARGHALFTVELFRRMREEGLVVLDENQRWVEGDAPLDWNRLPARVDAVIAERIGRLDPELQDILSVASVEGERFTLEAVAEVRGTEPSRLLTMMNQELGRRHQLVAPEGIRRINGQRLSIYRFRHILFQRRLYDRLNQIERAHLHEQVAEALEHLYGEHTEEIALELAHHFREANLPQKASGHYFLAGQQAKRSFAPGDALAHYEAGLHALLATPRSDDRDHLEVQFQLAVGHMRIALPAPGADVAFTRALELAERVGTTADKFWTTGSIYWAQHYAGEWDKWEPTSQRCLSLARESGDPTLLLAGLAVATHGAYYSGNLKLTIAFGEEFLATYGSRGHFSPILPGFDLGAGILLWMGQALFKSGRPMQGLRRIRAAISQTREANDLISLHVVLGFGSGVLAQAGDYISAKSWAKESFQVQAESGEFGQVGPLPLIWLNWCDLILNPTEDTASSLIEAVEKWDFPIATAYFRTFRAVAMEIIGHGEEGQQDMEEAMAIPEWNGPHHRSDVQRIYGDLLVGLPEPDLSAAEAAYREAMEIARDQGARSDELRAATRLALLLKSQSRTNEAMGILSSVYESFTEGHELPYLLEARNLLENLESC